jgi:hypothetical protein
MCKNPNENAGNVIKGPWKKRKKNLPDKKAIAEQLARSAADDITMKVIQQMVRVMEESGIDIGEASFIRDTAMIFELVQGAVYRDIEFSHPIHKFVEEFVNVEIHPDNTIGTEVDFDYMMALVEMLEDNDGPEIS